MKTLSVYPPNFVLQILIYKNLLFLLADLVAAQVAAQTAHNVGTASAHTEGASRHVLVIQPKHLHLLGDHSLPLLKILSFTLKSLVLRSSIMFSRDIAQKPVHPSISE